MRDIFKVILGLDKKLKLKFCILFLAVLVLGFVNTLSVFSIAPVVDSLLDKNPEEVSAFTRIAADVINIEQFNLVSSFIFFGVVIILAGIGSVAVQYFVLNIKYSAVTEIVSRSYKQFFKSKYLFFSQADLGILLNSFQRESEKIAITMQNVARFINYSIQILIYLFLPLYISTSMTSIFILAAACLCLPVFYLNKKVHPMGIKETSTFNIISKNLQESFSAAKLILSYGMQKKTVQKYINSYIDHANVAVPLQLIVFTINVMVIPMGMIAALLAIYWGYVNGIDLAEITMILFAFFRMLPLVGQLSQTRSEIVGFIPAIEQLNQLTEQAKLNEEIFDGNDFIDFNDEIVFENISFTYPDGKEALKDINLTIPKNKRIAIVGSSGSGKTTLADILMGLYSPTSGDIKIDGRSIKQFNLGTFRNRLVYVPQEPFLFNDTIKNNLLWSMPNASDEDIWEALRISYSEEFVMSLPNKIDAVVGDRGGRLSGGQRQRLSLARALIKKPSVLILDESTSSLDSESEAFIQNSIDKISEYVTVISIAHRLSTIKNADIVYVVNDGRIIESGEYEILIEDTNSHFSKMIKMQDSELI